MSLTTQPNNRAPDVLLSSSWADEVEETESLTSSSLTSPIQAKKPELNFSKGTRNNFNQGYNKYSNSYQNHKKPEPRTILRRESGSGFPNKDDQFNHQKNSYQTNHFKKSTESLPAAINKSRLSSSAPNHSRSFKSRNTTSPNNNSPPNSEYPKKASFPDTKIAGTSDVKPVSSTGPVSSRWSSSEENHMNSGSKDYKPRKNDLYNSRNFSNNFSKNNSRGVPIHSEGVFSIKHKDIQEEKNTQQIKGPEALRWSAAESALQNIGNAIKQNETGTSSSTSKPSLQKTLVDPEVVASNSILFPLPKKGLGYRSTSRLEWVNCPKDVSYVDVLTLYGDFKDDKAISVSYSSNNTLYLLFTTPDDAELAIRRHTLMARAGNLKRVPQIEPPKIPTEPPEL